MEKIKILIFVGRMEGGGVEAFVMNYFKQLYDRADFTFMITDDSTVIPEEEIKSRGAKLVVVPPPKKLFKFNKAMKEHLKSNHYDIIHSHVNTLSVFPLRIAKKYGIKVRIAHSHSSSSKKEVVRHIIKLILKNFSKVYANAYFTCSESAGRFQFGNKTYDAGEVYLVRNAIDVNRFLFDENKRKIARDSLGLKDDEYVAGTVSRLVHAKNHEFMIFLAKTMPNYKFFIVGVGVMQQELQELIDKENVTNIAIINPIYDISYYYSAFDVFLMPSLYEGFGLAAVEAESNGLYALLSVNIPKETLITGYGEYLPIGEDDYDKWKAAIEKEQKREFHVDRIIDSGFDIKTEADSLFEKYQKLVEENK